MNLSFHEILLGKTKHTRDVLLWIGFFLKPIQGFLSYGNRLRQYDQHKKVLTTIFSVFIVLKVCQVSNYLL